MDSKRLDFDAPLLSVRRIAAAASGSTLPKTPATKSRLPFYRSDSKTGPVGNPGVVPFQWERTPGQPKGTAATTTTSSPCAILKEDEMEDPNPNDDAFSDALETLSGSDSFFGDCSGSGRDDPEPSGSFSKDPAVRNFMIDRFLPAAKAMAIGPLQFASRKPPPPPPQRATNYGRQQLPIPLSYQLKYEDDQDDRYDDEEEAKEEDYDENRHFSKACGLIPRFCLKSSFLLLNPVPGMRDFKLSPQIKSPGPRSIGKAGDENSWEAVYEHKLDLEDCGLRDDGSKLTSESNRLTYWSDSQTPDGSSPYHHSTGGGASPFVEGKGFLGVPKRELKGRDIDSFDSCEGIAELQGSDSTSPSIDRTLYLDSVHMLDSSEDATDDTKGMPSSAIKNSELIVESLRVEESQVIETNGTDVVQPKSSEVVEIKETGSGFREQCSDDGPQALKVEDKEKSDAGLLLSLLPPPLPKSPSDSWLQRTLPSVSSKKPSSQSFLGMQVQCKKQVSWGSNDLEGATNEKPLKPRTRQTRFAEVVTTSTISQFGN